MITNGTITTTTWPYDNGTAAPYISVPSVWTWPMPDVCIGNLHVWACEHAESCKCGQATRAMPKCPGCGK